MNRYWFFFVENTLLLEIVAQDTVYYICLDLKSIIYVLNYVNCQLVSFSLLSTKFTTRPGQQIMTKQTSVHMYATYIDVCDFLESIIV